MRGTGVRSRSRSGAASRTRWRAAPLRRRRHDHRARHPVGADLAERAFHFLRALPNVDLDGIRVVDEPNNRVELRYQDRERRCERLTGGVGPWTWPELRPRRRLDALYINFISGFELELPTAHRCAPHFAGPIYADLHSLMLGVGPGGVRMPRPLEAWREWLRCFDAVQVNEDELGRWRTRGATRGCSPPRPWATSRACCSSRWASAAPPTSPRPTSTRTRARLAARPFSCRGIAAQGPCARSGCPPSCGPGTATPRAAATSGAPASSAHCSPAAARRRHARANRGRRRNVEHRGATGLHHHLQGRIARERHHTARFAGRALLRAVARARRRRETARVLFDATHVRWADPYGMVGCWPSARSRAPRRAADPQAAGIAGRHQLHGPHGLLRPRRAIFELNGPRPRGRPRAVRRAARDHAINSHADVHTVVDLVNQRGCAS
jgi:hypothetical protein